MSRQLVRGYNGGCEKGFTLYVQNQFSVASGVYGTLVRRSLDFKNTKADSVGLKGNEPLRAVGWTNVGRVVQDLNPDYAKNPKGLRGEVWFRARLPDGSWAWVPDAGVRVIETQPSPGDRDEDFDPETQAAPQSPGCELFPL